MKKLFNALTNLISDSSNFIQCNNLLLRICYNDAPRQGCSSKCDKPEEDKVSEWHFERRPTIGGKINIHYWDDMLTDININITYDQWHTFTKKLEERINKQCQELINT